MKTIFVFMLLTFVASASFAHINIHGPVCMVVSSVEVREETKLKPTDPTKFYYQVLGAKDGVEKEFNIPFENELVQENLQMAFASKGSNGEKSICVYDEHNLSYQWLTLKETLFLYPTI